MDFNSILLIIGIVAAIAGALIGFWLGFSPFKDEKPEVGIGVGILGATLGAVAGFFLSLLVVALLTIAVLAWLIMISAEWLILTLSVPACLLTKDWAMRNTGVCIPAPVFLIGLHRRESSSAVIFHA